MAVKDLSSYKDDLFSCRFCPMCKPAAEVANVTLIESYSTRARAMMLWRVVSGIAGFTARDTEIIYQSTLDSISQAWCVNHYPVSEYLTAARAEIFRKGLAPEQVKNALNNYTARTESAYENQGFRPADQAGDAIILASEAAEIGGEKLLKPVLSVLEKAGVPAKTLLIESGAMAYSLGALELASKQALRVIGLIKKTGTEKVITDGPRAMYAIKYIYPLLDIPWPEHIAVTSVSEELYSAVTGGKLKRAVTAGSRIIFHDSRSACALADELAEDQAIQPGFQGPEIVLGRGEIFEAPRRLADLLGMERIFSVWSRTFCKSCGADDGLWLTYPELAADLAEQRLRDAENLGAEMIVTDSLLCAEHLKSVRLADSVGIRWLPELFL